MSQMSGFVTGKAWKFVIPKRKSVEMDMNLIYMHKASKNSLGILHLISAEGFFGPFQNMPDFME